MDADCMMQLQLAAVRVEGRRRTVPDSVQYASILNQVENLVDPQPYLPPADLCRVIRISVEVFLRMFLLQKNNFGFSTDPEEGESFYPKKSTKI